MDNRRTLKLGVLLAVAVAVLVVLVLAVQDERQVRISTQPQGLVEGVDAEGVAEAARVTSVLKDARYGGEDGAGNRWEITAAEAVQQGGREDQALALREITARWEGGDVVDVTAGQGVYVQVSQTLQLEGGVTVKGAGLTMTMPAAKADVAAYALESDGGDVRITGPLGGYEVTMTARRFDIRERGNVMRLRGKVHGVLVQ